MAITHTFVCAIADDATAAANGEVVPSNWNADHAVTNLVLTHGTIATDVNTLGATVTWNAAGVTFTGIKLNVTDTASAAGSLLQDWQVGGVSKASIGKDGVLKLGGPVAGAATFTWSSANSLVLSSTDGYQRVKAYSLWHTNGYSGIGDSGVANGPAMQICSSDGLGWTSAAAIGGGTFDVRLWRDAAATLALRDGTNAQTFRVYGTYTDSSNYVRASLSSSSTAITLAAETAGTGADNIDINLTPAGAGSVVISNGTVTADAPLLDLAQTWNAGGVTFTGIKLNVTDTASHADSRALNVLVGGYSYLSLSTAGMLRFAECLSEAGIYCGADVSLGNSSVASDNQGVAIRSDYSIKWSEDTTRYGAKDLLLSRDAAGVLAQRNSTNAQTYRVYGTYTDSSNYVRASLASSSTAITLAAETAGTGADNVPVNITPAGTEGTQFTNFAQLTEMTAPAAGAANTARIFAEDNGSGKTRLMVQFASGAAVQLAIEP